MKKVFLAIPLVLSLVGCSGFGGDRRIQCKIGVPGIFEIEWGSSVDGSYPVPQTVNAAPAK